MQLKKSLAAFERAKKNIPLATQTFSKSYLQLSVGTMPLFLERGQGSHVWDVDGNEYVDQIMSLAPIILGYCYPEVDEAVARQLKRGTILSLPGILETEVAERIQALVPSAEMVRFGKNGSDVTAGAVRVARAYTGREIIVCCGYHGWQDWCIGTTTRNKGVPKSTQELTKTFVYNDIQSLEKIFSEYHNQVAAVIMEPIGIEFPKDNFLQKVKDVAHENGAVLVFDEVVTGFRISLGGAQEYFKVIPDLSCFGKALANGFPLSALVGKKEIMKECEEIFFSFTFGGELLSLAAALATLTVLERDKVCEYINKLGAKHSDCYNALAKEFGLSERTKTVGYGTHHVIIFKDEQGQDDLAAKTIFQETMAENGVLTIASNNFCFSHNEADKKIIVNGYKKALERIKTGVEKNNLETLIRGQKVQPVFRKP